MLKLDLNIIRKTSDLLSERVRDADPSMLINWPIYICKAVPPEISKDCSELRFSISKKEKKNRITIMVIIKLRWFNLALFNSDCVYF